MANYDVFASYYDSLTKNVDYAGRADYLLSLLERLNHTAGITLDLACGTGNLTFELFKRGVDVYGADASNSMLSIAKDKAYEIEADILFLCQKMENLDLFGTINTTFCCLDSINHLGSKEKIQKSFDKVSLFTEANGYFIFDFNTPYKHKNILADNTYVYDIKDVFCVWQNNYNEKMNRVDITLDFFEEDIFNKSNTRYIRSRERFFEISFENEVIVEMLEKSGFMDIQIFDDMSFEKPKENSQRVIFVAKKPN